ncbi:MAG: isoprenylcysteine carboxylmethyltransferase family protein [Synergistales bacterium]|nr:isoprenylcysteine carboxylmethyltransferase family protein [Synergistales bacterium]MDY6401858.1 isoprenylcysteine carboxylmethyltransferase family protein [Synergistales bacterium]MDY6403872.1 isoprenylcysteine carboxylmethyltransferase family protein [Synergistales bacterium]MDY6409906.1 isoprenylcysteine carboxylmethyltransferase family protein [Synergistales bacterium]MDY6414780.1 isoprenylcysteine carboxylmethyltransferase family protein [Synergistales bacterium]
MREWVFKMRGGLWTLLFLIILFTAKKTTLNQILTALIFIIAGQLWRCWAVGFIGLYRGENVKAQKLATKGPYALMRNPLYFGNFLIGIGWAIIAGLHAVIIFCVSFYLLYNAAIIPHEENFLRSKFGIEFEAYCKRVKRFFPKEFNLQDLKGNFDKKILLKSEIHTIISTLIGTVIIISVCTFLQ